MSGELEQPEMPKDEQVAALLKALEENPGAVDAMLAARGTREGVVRPENSKWEHGSGWGVDPEPRRRGIT